MSLVISRLLMESDIVIGIFFQLWPYDCTLKHNITQIIFLGCHIHTVALTIMPRVFSHTVDLSSGL